MPSWRSCGSVYLRRAGCWRLAAGQANMQLIFQMLSLTLNGFRVICHRILKGYRSGAKMQGRTVLRQRVWIYCLMHCNCRQRMRSSVSIPCILSLGRARTNCLRQRGRRCPRARPYISRDPTAMLTVRSSRATSRLINGGRSGIPQAVSEISRTSAGLPKSRVLPLRRMRPCRQTIGL